MPIDGNEGSRSPDPGTAVNYGRPLKWRLKNGTLQSQDDLWSLNFEPSDSMQRKNKGLGSGYVIKPTYFGKPVEIEQILGICWSSVIRPCMEAKLLDFTHLFTSNQPQRHSRRMSSPFFYGPLVKIWHGAQFFESCKRHHQHSLCWKAQPRRRAHEPCKQKWKIEQHNPIFSECDVCTIEEKCWIWCSKEQVWVAHTLMCCRASI